MNKKDVKNLDEIKNIIFSNKLKYNPEKNEFFSQQITDIKNIKPIRVGTAFSGVGAFEQALQVLGLPMKLFSLVIMGV